MSQASWDANKTVNSDGSESIHHGTGNAESVAFSQSDMNTSQQLSVYQHYNPTDLPLAAAKDEKGMGMQFEATKKTDTYPSGERRITITTKININLNANKNGAKVGDHANEITSMFSHENKHYSDFKELGFRAYSSTPEPVRETRAINAQMQHPSWNNTRTGFQNAIKKYGKGFGMTF
jgi:hypothetical protein